MKFHLNYQPIISEQKITHQSEVFFLGSCFSEHIGEKLNDLKFNIISNPFGIMFNPLSIANILNRAIQKKYFQRSDVFQKNDVWLCYETHSSVYALTDTDLVNDLNETINNIHEKLKTINWLCITFGSAYYYNLLSNKQAVANCHKQPAHLFEKKCVAASEITSVFNQIQHDLLKINPSIRFIYTVSPVKHLKDGLIENSLSKAILIQSSHQLIHQLANGYYFPAYELINDDLRDYRFYEKDLAHPNQLAIEYVWGKFSETFFDSETLNLNLSLQQINLALKHKPFQENSSEYLDFKAKFYAKCKTLDLNYSYLNLKSELNFFNNQ